LTTFGGKSAYPVYITIGNIPKALRRKPSRQAQILLGYLPTTDLKHVQNKAQRRRMMGNLFHSCMRKILEPLVDAGKDGIKMQTADGLWRRCHPIFAAFIGDYPEQLLVTCTKKGHCPMCTAPVDGIGDAIHNAPRRNLNDVMVALGTLRKGPVEYSKACKLVNIKPVQHPFWEQLPYTNIYQSITPDILHQLYQGVIKHLFTWLKTLYSKAEIDARCRRLPPNHHLRHFSNGISHMKRLTGKEHSQIAHVLLGLIIDARLPENASPNRLLRAVRALLDFMFLAQYPVHTSSTLQQLDDALERWHANKNTFLTLGTRNDFDIPKFHALEHYVQMIKVFGTTDNYNTEYTERLHIDMAKDAYRSTNHKDEFPQMTLWLERREKILEHEKLVRRRQQTNISPNPSGSAPKTVVEPSPLWELKMPKEPSARRLSFTGLSEHHGATDIRQALARFVISKLNPSSTWTRIVREAANLTFPESFSIPTYHFVKFTQRDPHGHLNQSSTSDIIHASPVRENARGHDIPARFDTVLIGNKTEGGPQAYRIAQVRVVFTLPCRVIEEDSNGDNRIHLAYVELFTKLPSAPEPNHGLYRIKRELKDGARVARIIPVSHIRRSVQLFPRFKRSAPAEWTSSRVLEQCSEFFVNSLSDRHLFNDFHVSP
ncbi:hypothetical protein BDN72DRAFT_781632, partial [Pluteus cervinus]